MIRRAILLSLAGLAGASCGNNVASTTQAIDRKDVPTMTAPAAPSLAPRAPLPFEPKSKAELLSSSHLFTVEVVTAQASPWAVGQDGLEHRSMALGLRLSAMLKGRLTVPAGEAFSVTLP